MSCRPGALFLCLYPFPSWGCAFLLSLPNYFQFPEWDILSHLWLLRFSFIKHVFSYSFKRLELPNHIITFSKTPKLAGFLFLSSQYARHCRLVCSFSSSPFSAVLSCKPIFFFQEFLVRCIYIGSERESEMKAIFSNFSSISTGSQSNGDIKFLNNNTLITRTIVIYQITATTECPSVW